MSAGILGFLIGLPTLRLKGDYLAIATLGLGEIIRIVIMNIEYVGGAAGFKGIPHNTTFPWVFFIMLFTLFFIKTLLILNMVVLVLLYVKMRLQQKLWVLILQNIK